MPSLVSLSVGLKVLLIKEKKKNQESHHFVGLGLKQESWTLVIVERFLRTISQENAMSHSKQ